MQALVKELQSGQLPLVRANGPFGCVKGHKWGGHEVMVIFAGGIGVGSSYPHSVSTLYAACNMNMPD